MRKLLAFLGVLFVCGTAYAIGVSPGPGIALNSAIGNFWKLGTTVDGNGNQAINIAFTSTGPNVTLNDALGNFWNLGTTVDGNGNQAVEVACVSGCPSSPSTLLSSNNVWTGQNSNTPATLSISTATFTPNGSANNYGLTLVHASCPCTIANPSATPVAGTAGQIVINQSATGSDTIGTWGSEYKFAGGTKPTLSTAANAVDIISYYVVSPTFIAVTFAGAGFQ